MIPRQQILGLSRRRFLSGLSLSVGSAWMPATVHSVAQGVNQGGNQKISPSAVIPSLKPPRLKPGDGVGLISPAGATFLEEQLEIVQDAMRGLGLVPRLGLHVGDRYGYLGGTDRERAADINRFFADPTIQLLMPIQGGWGSSRTLPYLDYDLIRRNPKVFIGFSDITALLLGIQAKTNLVTFHGPHGLTGWRTEQVEIFRRVLFDGQSVTFRNGLDGGDGDRLMRVNFRARTITSGTAQGPLFGGNLSVLSGLVGSPYLPNWKGAILFLEDIGESIYRIDRFLTHLKLAGILDQLAGFIFGQCPNCSPGEDYGSLTLEQVLQDHIKPLGIPAWSGAMVGHVETLWTLPLGLPVAIDASAATLQMVESAVR